MFKTLLTVLSLFATGCYAQLLDLAEKQTRLQFEVPTKNKAEDIMAAKIVTEKIYIFHQNHAGAGDSILSAVISYDDNGRLTAREEFTGKKIIEKTYRYFFDNAGNLAKQRIRSTADKKSFHYTEIEYNIARLETFKYDYDDDSANMRIIKKEYNDQHQYCRLLFMDKDGEFKRLKEYTYDKKGDMTKVDLFFTYMPNGLPSKTIFFQPLDNNRSESVYLEDTRMARYYYDTIGRCTEEINPTIHISSNTSADGKLTVSSNGFGSPYYTAEEYTIPASLYQTTSVNLLFSSDRIDNIIPQPISTLGNNRSFSIDNAAGSTHYKKGESVRQHLYNDNGTINQTTVFSDGTCVAIIKHFYQTK